MILTGKNCILFISVQEWLVGCFLPFSCVYKYSWFTKSIKFFYYRVLRVQKCLKNVIHQIDSKNDWLLLQTSFAAKSGLVFVLHWKTLFLRGFILRPAERAQVLLKKGTMDFQNSPPFERSVCFYVTISESFKRFQYFNFETNFLENENLFQKTGVAFFS